ncbi:MAG TPA: DUF2892 domain-containing protein [Gammaproteobacteria bacterium]|nr:DUF2892 domain-containing protein [Gammaproteobacteria bacterium]
MSSVKPILPYIEPTIRSLAGGLIIIMGILLGAQYEVAAIWLGVLFFVGFNLFQSGFTNWCLMEKILTRLNFRSELCEIKMLSEELQRSAQQQANYLDTLALLNEAVIELTRDGFIINASDGWAKLIGYPSNKASLNEPLANYVVSSDRPLLANLLTELNEGQRKVHGINFRLLGDGGTERRGRWVSGNFMLAKHGDNPPFIKGVLCNISERKRVEDERKKHQEELSHVHRLSSLGEMAAGLAHELNQPLAAINLYMQGCLRRLEENPAQLDEIRAAMESASLQAQRAGDIISQIRSFVRNAPMDCQPVDLNRLIRDTIHLFDADPTMSRTRLKLELAENLPLRNIDRLRIEQVLVNLINNANDAMRDSPSEAREITIRTRQESGIVTVSIEDRGKGIPEDIADRIFEPFVTHSNCGLGLGLSISRSIIEEHGGTLYCHTRTNGGTAFSFTLPDTLPGTTS